MISPQVDGPKYIQRGSFGCIFRPPLRCEGEEESNRKNKSFVSRIANDSESFLQKSKPWRDIDPEGNYYVTPEPYTCKVHPNNKKKYTNRYGCSKRSQSFMKFAGIDLYDAFQKKAVKRNDFFSLFEAFGKLLEGIQMAHEHHIYHLDLKIENILIGRIKTGFFMKAIDFDYSVYEENSIVSPIHKNFRSIQTNYHPLDIYFAYFLQNNLDLFKRNSTVNDTVISPVTQMDRKKEVSNVLRNSNTFGTPGFEKKGIPFVQKYINDLLKIQMEDDDGFAFTIYPVSNLSDTMQNQIYLRFVQTLKNIKNSANVDEAIQTTIQDYLAATDVYMLGLTLSRILYKSTNYIKSIQRWKESATEIEPILQNYNQINEDDYDKQDFFQEFSNSFIKPMFQLIGDMVKPITNFRIQLTDVIEQYNKIIVEAKKTVSKDDIQKYLTSLPLNVTPKKGGAHQTRRKRVRRNNTRRYR
jgi:serine/threonine protein kinase